MSAAPHHNVGLALVPVPDSECWVLTLVSVSEQLEVESAQKFRVSLDESHGGMTCASSSLLVCALSALCDPAIRIYVWNDVQMESFLALYRGVNRAMVAPPERSQFVSLAERLQFESTDTFERALAECTRAKTPMARAQACALWGAAPRRAA